MANVKAFGKDPDGNHVEIAVNADGGLILDPGSVGAGGGGSGSGLTDTQLRAAPVPVSLDAGSLAALESIDATISDGGGSITVDGSVSVSNLPGTQTVDGTVELGATTLAALESVTVVDGGGSLTVDGTVGVSGTVPVSGPLTDTQLRASAVPVSDGGGSLTVDGTVGVSGSVAVTGPLTDTQLRATAVPVSGTFYQATQPVSGTVTANAGTGPWPVTDNGGNLSVDDGGGSLTVDGTFWQATQPVSAASLPLPSGAATAAKQPALGAAGTPSSDVLTVQGVASMTALKVDGSGVTQPVSGTFWQTTQPVSGPLTDTQLRASAVPVSGTFYPATQPVSGTVALDSGTITSLTTGGGLTDTQLRASPVPVSQTDATASGSLTSASGAGSTVQIAVNGHSAIGFSFSGTFSGLTIVVERSVDGGTTWLPSAFYRSVGTTFFLVAASVSSTGIASGYQVLGDAVGATHLRVRAVAFSSGTATVAVATTAASVPVAFSLLDANGNTSTVLRTTSGTALGTAQPTSDNIATAFQALQVSAVQMLYNELGADRQRNNTDVSVLSSSARTVATNTADQVNYNARAVIITISVTAAGTGGLTPTVKGKATIPGTYYALGSAFTKITATGTYVYIVGMQAPAAVAGGITASLVAPVPRTWRLEIGVDDSSSWTYSVAIGHLV